MQATSFRRRYAEWMTAAALLAALSFAPAIAAERVVLCEEFTSTT